MARAKKDTTQEGAAIGERRYAFYDLDACIEVARVLQDRGGGALTVDQLVPATGHKGRSGSFLTKLASARLFGLIGGTDGGTIRITDRGIHILHPGTDRQAKCDAFLAVPLFGAVYRTYKDKPLPPKDGLISAFKSSFGVPDTQVDYAYRSLRSSAATAGFLEATGGEPTRLVMPILTQRPGDAGGPKLPKDERLPPEKPRPEEISTPRSVRGAVDMLPVEGSTITTIKLNGLVEAYRTALLMAYEVVKDDGA